MIANHQNIKILQLQKQDIETILAEHEQRAGRSLPQPYETEFWVYHQKRAISSFLSFSKIGGIIYLCCAIFIVFRNYFIIPALYIEHDYWRGLLSASNGAFCLSLLVLIARHPKAQHYFGYVALFIIGWAIYLTAVLTLSQYTSSIRQQFVFIAFVFIFGYVMTGVKPLHMFVVGLISSAAIFATFFYFQVKFDLVVCLRVFVGSNMIGFGITKIMNHQERMSFLKTKLIGVDQQILKEYNDQLLTLSQFDGLTNVSNRRSLDATLERYHALAQSEQQPLAVVFIDIDYFKFYNDYYGHPQGDAVLKAIAHAIQNTVRDQDFVARYGGEEFVVLLPNTDVHQAYRIASHISKAVDELQIHHAKSEISPHITISLGVAVYSTEHQISSQQLLYFADQALYRAKACGRHQISQHEIRDYDDVEAQKKAT
ncbi:GGDEF domain-containing protein [Acinetobacter sp. MB5]|uniref:GGDEF domain-containing protein n=1 Tax=Acinetobacter sp. MB5 TaxID=2069438 RepID=UPI001D0DA400|nr:GGDEF domain-containing protein [Acinetobacter sp. MB5]